MADLHISMDTRLNGHVCVASNLVFIENKKPCNNTGGELWLNLSTGEKIQNGGLSWD